MSIPVVACGTKQIKVPGAPLKRTPEKFPWPRMADDGKTPLGIDVKAKMIDIQKIVGKFFKVQDMSMEELLQEVYLAIVHKNYTRSAHDPRKSSFGHYVYMIANNVCINIVHKKKRYDKERDSIDAPYGQDDKRILSEIIEDESANMEKKIDAFSEYATLVENELCKGGMWHHLRYLRIARSGASSDVIKEALSFGDRKISNKSLRELRIDMQDFVRQLDVDVSRI